MKLTRVFAVLSASALAFGAVPVLAEEETLPAACGGVAPVLAEGETLQEHTLYLHGKSPVGEQDGVEDLLASSASGTYMDATEPSEPVSKVDANLATAANDEFNGNPMLSYWATSFEEPTRMVCASATVFTTDNGSPTFQLFFDQPYAGATVGASTKSTTGTGTGVRTVTGAFKPFDVLIDYDLTFQVIASRPGMQMLYDSTTHPASFTYVTVVPAPEPVPTEEPTTTP